MSFDLQTWHICTDNFYKQHCDLTSVYNNDDGFECTTDIRYKFLVPLLPVTYQATTLTTHHDGPGSWGRAASGLLWQLRARSSCRQPLENQTSCRNLLPPPLQNSSAYWYVEVVKEKHDQGCLNSILILFFSLSPLWMVPTVLHRKFYSHHSSLIPRLLDREEYNRWGRGMVVLKY